MKTIKVVCGIIRSEGKIFVARRKPGKSMGGFWEFPGGKIEADETPQLALARELKEELGMAVHVGDHFYTNIYAYENFTIELMAYRADFISGSYTLTDHDAYEWRTPGSLSDLNWAPADVKIVEMILREE